MTVLLAKSRRSDRPEVTLEAHLRDTERSAVALFRPDGRWGRALRRFFKLAQPQAESFLLNLRVAALFHDIGKANAGFLAAMEHRGNQSVRHEHLSALVLCAPDVRRWLCGNPELDADAITAAVLSHHLKASPSGDWAWGALTGDKRVGMLLDHPEVRAILARVSDVAGLDDPPELPKTAFPEGEWTGFRDQGTQLARAFGRSAADGPRRRLAGALKVGLIAADSVASALVRTDQDIDAWIADVVHRAPLAANDVKTDIIGPRQQQLGARFTGLHRFQASAANLGPRALLVAPCGSGKTLGAWEWARACAENHEVGRVIFLYPTRGTATEGFRDYVGWAPEGAGALVHGTAPFELEAMAANPPESVRGKVLVDESSGRLFALGLWKHKYFSATVDQFLAFMEHSYTSLCLLPALADALVVVDEVHSFDGRMFEDFVQFLKAFDVPVLAMTATLPKDRRQRLIDAGLRMYPDAAEMADLPDLEAEARHPRYRIRRVAGADAAMIDVQRAWIDGKRILWVVNTVDRCQGLARQLDDVLSTQVTAYHSRYKLADRREAHERTVRSFQQTGAAAIAVTTQVCEMSLDLDADVLVTEWAPVTSLVQRFGRVNRNRKQAGRDDAFRGEILTYRPDGERPYEREDYVAAERFIDTVLGDASQEALAIALERHARPESRVDATARFLGSGYYATVGKLRDGEEFGLPCVLDEDVPAVVEAAARRRPIDGWVITVPRGQAGDGRDDLPRYLHVAAASSYDKRLGFTTRRAE